jgi:hypothetical protein
MPEPIDGSAGPEGTTLRAMTLLSTLAAAVEVWQKARERAAGHDPSAQEDDAFVRPVLRRAGRDLEALLMPLRASLAYTTVAEDGGPGATVRRFEDLLKLHRIARLLQGTHQRLLSLYPAVGEALVEEARLLYAEAERLADVEEDGFADGVARFVDRTLQFTAWMQREL